MTQPTTYARQYNFTNYQASSPANPLPAVKVDLEFNALKITLDQVLYNLALIQKDDTSLANNSVGLRQLKPELLISVAANLATDWVTATAYAAKAFVWQSNNLYICNTAHTSGTFSTDLAATKWTLVSNYNDPVTTATSAAADAEAAQTAAEAAQTAAEAAQTASEAAQVAAEAAAADAEAFVLGLTLPLPVSLGGHGGSTAAQARSNLGAAAAAQQILAGTGLTGGGTLAADRTLTLANTSVTPASYGSATQVGTFNVDQQGRITAASNVSIVVQTANIADDAVSYAKMQNVTAQYRLIGRISGGAGDAQELTPDNLMTVIGQASTVPAFQNGITTGSNVVTVGSTTTDGVKLTSTSIQGFANGASACLLGRGTSDGSLLGCYRGTTNVGSISVTGSATAYNTSSDGRLKDERAPLGDTGALFDALEPLSFRWKTIPGQPRAVGFIAQDLCEIVPEAVVRGDDNPDLLPGDEGFEQWQADYGKLIPYMVAEIQALRARVAQLEAAL